MEVYRRSSGLLLLLGLSLLATTLQGVQGEVEAEGPSESECRPYIEKALKELEAGEVDVGSSAELGDSKEDVPTVEITDDSDHQEGDGEKDDTNEDGQESTENETVSEIKPEPEVRQTFIQKVSSFFQKIFKKTPSKKEEAANESERSEDKQDDASPQRGDQPAIDDTDSREPEREDDSKEGESKEDNSKDDTASIEELEKDDDSKKGDSHKEGSKEEVDSEEQTKEEIDAETKEEDDDSKEKEADVDAESKEQTKDTLDTSDEQKESVEEIFEAVEAQTLTQSSDQPEDESKEENQPTDTDQDVKESVEEERPQADEAQPDNVQDIPEDAKDDSKEDTKSDSKEDAKDKDSKEDTADGSREDLKEESQEVGKESSEEDGKGDDEGDSKPDEQGEDEDNTKEETKNDSKEDTTTDEDNIKQESAEDTEKSNESQESKDNKSEEKDEGDNKSEEKADKKSVEESKEADKDKSDSKEDTKDDSTEQEADDKTDSAKLSKEDDNEDDHDDKKEDTDQSEEAVKDSKEAQDDSNSNEEEDAKSTEDGGPVEELSLDTEIPTDLKPRDHVEQLLKLDDQSSETETLINRVSEITLRDLKKLYDNAIKPLEAVYKYRDLSNRHFGDAEIFSKPLILFMGPWSGGKSTIINYLTNNEFNDTSLRTGAEPSPAYFNILMYGDEPEVIDGTELAADFTFSGLQKFGQGLEERLRGIKLPSKLLEKVNIVEIPGILEVRKQVSRVFPFNDACQWFIDRGDIIFLVYDPSKLDVGPETEAILDQLKGREHQTRIILNKADRVKPEELMRVQGALIWNISPLMSSPQPPIMYTTSLWSRPYEPWAPVRLLQAQERTFLRDLRGAIEKRIENKIASARRFAVRVRNHAKMVDCYLTTYYNHKSVFGNRKQVADAITEHPQDYHIYEGLSTLTNISRYDLPDPDVYRDFFKLNPLYEFQQLSATCTYFRGCPINRLDIAIAYDLPELLGTHKKRLETAFAEAAAGPQQTSVPGS